LRVRVMQTEDPHPQLKLYGWVEFLDYRWISWIAFIYLNCLYLLELLDFLEFHDWFKGMTLRYIDLLNSLNSLNFLELPILDRGYISRFFKLKWYYVPSECWFLLKKIDFNILQDVILDDAAVFSLAKLRSVPRHSK
jgi:hypothetical protein